MFEYKAKLIRVIDGDTLVMMVDMGFYLFQEMKLRLNGINTPELIGGNDKEKALEAKTFVEQELKDCYIAIRTYKVEKWGRFVADVYYHPSIMKTEELFTNGKVLSEVLLAKGFAELYEG